MTNDCTLLDLAAGLLPVIDAHLGRPFEEQLAAWQGFYALHAPSLPGRLYEDYSDEEGGWLPIARGRIWPRHPERMELMTSANKAIREYYSDVYRLAVDRLGFAGPLAVVTYVGIGNGAGWATRWEGDPAILLGLENIADLGWHTPPSVRGLMAHEIGHLFMTSVRGAGDSESFAGDPLLKLFGEGFAQHCEHVISGRWTWHCASQPGWIEWCTANEARLAREYLRRIRDKESCREFFGSWLDIEGWRQTGYFLGCRLVERMARPRGLREIAGLSERDVRQSVAEYLQSVS